MDDILEYLDEVNEKMDCFVSKMDQATASDLKLDDRAGNRLWVSKDCLIVRKFRNGSLRYYGGFEYVDESSIAIIGDYVIYLASDERVQKHLNRYYGVEEREEEYVE